MLYCLFIITSYITIGCITGFLYGLSVQLQAQRALSIPIHALATLRFIGIGLLFTYLLHSHQFGFILFLIGFLAILLMRVIYT